MKAVIDRSGCIGCRLCADTCPEVFRMADDGFAEVYGTITPRTEPDARAAVENCPVSVISIEK